MIVAAFAGQTATGFSIPIAATAFGSIATVLALVLLWHGLQAQTNELALQEEKLREQREQMSKITRQAQRAASPAEQIPDFMYAPEDPRLFLRPENSMGEAAIVLVLKNNGAQIWGVSLYWQYQERMHFIDETHPTLVGEASGHLPARHDYESKLDRYLAQVQHLKSRLGIPLVASLNGDSLSGWVELGRELEAAGADALELNAWHLPGSPDETGSAVEDASSPCSAN